MMTIRDATTDDARALAELHVHAWRQAYAGLIAQSYLDGLSVEKREAAWRQIIETGVTSTKLHIIDGELAGFASYGRWRTDDGTEDCPNEHASELLAIYYTQAHWGTGRAVELMNLALRDLTAAGFPECRVWVLSSNSRAIAFYEKHGFSVDGHEKTDDRNAPGGEAVALHEIRMTRLLTTAAPESGSMAATFGPHRRHR